MAVVPVLRSREPAPARALDDPKRPPPGDIDIQDDRGRSTRAPRIRCPKCGWEPRHFDRWQCRCLYVWNTFDTRGRCPGCGYQWTITACLACHQWSPHEDWYEHPRGS